MILDSGDIGHLSMELHQRQVEVVRYCPYDSTRLIYDVDTDKYACLECERLFRNVTPRLTQGVHRGNRPLSRRVLTRAGNAH